MSIADLGSLGEFIGSMAVLVTLIYLALQIRQNTHATRAVSHHAVTDALNQLNLTLSKHDEATRIWLAGMNDRSSLNDVQRERYDSLLRAYLHVCDTMYYQAQVGAGDHGLWEAEKRYLGMILTSDGGKNWLKENSESVSRGFRHALNPIIEKYLSTDPELTDPLRSRYGASRVQ